MDSESLTAATPTENKLNADHRLIYAHVAAVVLTAVAVLISLLGIASTPTWIPVACCAIIATVAVAFVVAAVKIAQQRSGRTFSDRIEFFSVVLGLSVLQAIFILPVLICVFAPTLRL